MRQSFQTRLITHLRGTLYKDSIILYRPDPENTKNTKFYLYLSNYSNYKNFKQFNFNSIITNNYVYWKELFQSIISLCYFKEELQIEGPYCFTGALEYLLFKDKHSDEVIVFKL